MFILESNFANSGKFQIEIDVDGNDETINSFDKIFNTIIKTFKINNLDNKIVTWFNSNFKNWLKNDAVGYVEYGDYIDKNSLHKLFYVSLDDVLKMFVSEYPNKNKEYFLDKMPDFIKKNPNNVTIFSYGRLYRFKKYPNFIKMMEELIDYLKIVIDNQKERNYVILPDSLFVRDISKLTPPQAIKNSYDYHIYTIRIGEKINSEKAKQLIQKLKPNNDYKSIYEKDLIKVVMALSSKYTDTEGLIMKHCVASYGKDVENKKLKILSVWDKKLSLPVATIELDKNGKIINQLKGKYNGEVNNKYHEDIQEFIKKEKLKFGQSTNDYKNIGLKSSSLKDITIEEFYSNLKSFVFLSENDDKKVKLKNDNKIKHQFKIFHGIEDGKITKYEKEKEHKTNVAPKIKSVNFLNTLNKTKNITLDRNSLLYFLNSNFDEEDIEDIEIPNIDIFKPKPTTLPKVITSALELAGFITPEWHAVKHLPGYFVSGIRSIGRKVFSPFTKTKIEDINVIANLNNSGPNSERELNAVAAFLQKYGTRNSKYELTFFDKIPGYEADVLLYTFANYTFLIVKDHAGYYIYVWPSTDNKNTLIDKSLEILQNK